MAQTKLERLSAATLSDANDSTASIEALISLAIGLAHFGDVAKASDLLQQIRRNPELSASPRSSIRVILLDGLVSFYGDLSRSALDRVRRAFHLACAGTDQLLVGECGVWAALVAFDFDDLALLEKSMSCASRIADQLDGTLQGRYSLLLADMNQLVGRSAVASKWYQRARGCSRMEVDRALMTAIEFNRLGMGISRMRLVEILEPLAPSIDDRNWLTESQSVSNMHYGMGANALPDLLEYCRVRLDAQLGDFSSAARRLRDFIRAGRSHLSGSSEQVLDLEVKLYETRSGNPTEHDHLPRPSLIDIEALPDSDRLLALHYFNQIFRATLEPDDLVRLDLALELAKRSCMDSLNTMRRIAEDCDQRLN